VTASPVPLLDRTNPHVDFVHHPFPACFVCGPDRAQSDGLHLFPGFVTPDVVAVSWRPRRLADRPTGTLPVRMVTSALDCPSAFAGLVPGSFALMASMTFHIERLPRVSDCVERHRQTSSGDGPSRSDPSGSYQAGSV
jgi:hypothetical protein